jgi:hypothetical protein
LAPREFIGVVHRRQAGAAHNIGIVAFSHGRKAAVKNQSPGDAPALRGIAPCDAANDSATDLPGHAP